MRHNVNNPEVVNSWVDHLNYDKVFPLIGSGRRSALLALAHCIFTMALPGIVARSAYSCQRIFAGGASA